MKNISNLRIGVRLGMGFTLVVMLAILLGAIALARMSTIDQSWKNFDQVTLAKRIAATNGYVSLGNGIHHFKNFLLRGGDYNKKFMSDMDQIDESVAKYRLAGSIAPEEDAVLQDVLKNSQNYRDAIAEMAKYKTESRSIEQIDKQIKGADHPLAAAFAKLLEINDATTQAKSGEFYQMIEIARNWVLGTCVMIVLLASVFAFWLTRSLTRPLAEAVLVANRLAEGDLTTRIEVTSKDETGQLLSAMDNMSTKLAQVIAEVRSSTDNISSASEQVSSTAQTLSQSTSEQAASVEATSASVEQMSASVEQNTENAKVTDGMAAQAAKQAREGGDAVNSTVVAMKQIADKIGITERAARTIVNGLEYELTTALVCTRL